MKSVFLWKSRKNKSGSLGLVQVQQFPLSSDPFSFQVGSIECVLCVCVNFGSDYN